MNNFKKIAAAYAINYGAIISNGNKADELVVIGLGAMAIHMKKLSNDCGGYHVYKDEFNADGDRVRGELFKIVGYVYIGQLGGNEKIPAGQRFRLRATNEMFISEKEQEKSFGTYHLYLLNDYKVSDENFHFHPEEIEPYFD